MKFLPRLTRYDLVELLQVDALFRSESSCVRSCHLLGHLSRKSLFHAHLSSLGILQLLFVARVGFVQVRKIGSHLENCVDGCDMHLSVLEPTDTIVRLTSHQGGG